MASRLLALGLLALGACGGETEGERGPAAQGLAPVRLLDRLAEARIEGLAADLAKGAPPSEPRTLLAADFEQGALAPFAPFFGHPGDAPGALARPAPEAASTLVRIVTGARAFAGGASVQLVGGVPHGVSLRSPPIPVSPEERYRLRYRRALDGVAGGPAGEPRGQVTLIFYRLEPDESGRAAQVVADPERERLRRVEPPHEMLLDQPPGRQPWSAEELEFGSGPLASHVVLSIDLSRPADDRSAHRATGVARFDEVELTAWREPPARRWRASDAPAAGPASLVLAATLAHPAHEKATETRPALAAPAPSAFTFSLGVPERAALELGVGLLPEAEIPGGAAVVFEVEVADAEGRVHPLWREAVAPRERPGWRDAALDLAAFAGQRVEVRLRTASQAPASERPEEARSASRLPGAGALFSDPTLRRRGERGRLALLVGIDTLAAQRTSLHGHPRDTTPHLAALAREGVLFRHVMAPSPWTLPSFASILTGLAAEQHGAGELTPDRGVYRALAPGFRTAAERLREAGWETRAFVNNPNLTVPFGLSQGFASWLDYGTRHAQDATQPALRALLDTLERSRGRDRFVFFHVLEPHGPYPAREALRRRFAATPEAAQPLGDRLFLAWSSAHEPVPEAERRRLEDLYAASMAQADEHLGRIAEAARRLAAEEEVVLAVTSDHGEELFEHGLFEHGHSLVEELLHVPLVVFAPGLAAGPRVVETPVAAHDVAATLLDWAGVETEPEPEPGAARSLLPLLRGEPAQGARDLFASRNLYGVQRLAVRRGDAKYVYNQQLNGQPVGRSPRPATRHELRRIGPDGREGPERSREEPALALELHDALAPLFVASLGGSYVVHLDGAGRRRLLAGSLTLPAGGVWHPRPRDFVWPGPDGSESPLEIRMRRERIEFRVEAERALLAFPLREGGGPIQLSLSLDGSPVGTGEVALGSRALAPQALPARVVDASLWLPAEALLPRRPADRPIQVGRVVEPPELRGVAAPAAGDPALRRQLEALGYVVE